MSSWTTRLRCDELIDCTRATIQTSSVDELISSSIRSQAAAAAIRKSKFNLHEDLFVCFRNFFFCLFLRSLFSISVWRKKQLNIAWNARSILPSKTKRQNRRSHIEIQQNKQTSKHARTAKTQDDKKKQAEKKTESQKKKKSENQRNHTHVNWSTLVEIKTKQNKTNETAKRYFCEFSSLF